MKRFVSVLFLLSCFALSAHGLAEGVATEESCEKGYVGIESFATCENGKLVLVPPPTASGIRQPDGKQADRKQADQKFETREALKPSAGRTN